MRYVHVEERKEERERECVCVEVYSETTATGELEGVKEADECFMGIASHTHLRPRRE